MTKQEKIREGLKRVILFSEVEGQTIGEYPDLTQRILNYLHSQGVVIKVEKELPRYPSLHSGGEQFDHHYDRGKRDGYKYSQQKMLSVGYVAVEPLIKEG